MSPTHCIIIDTNAYGQNTKLSNNNDGIYAGRAIMIGNECRIIRRVHENRNCNNRDGLVRYEVQFSGHTYQHHQFMVITQPNVGLGILRTITSSVNFVARGQGRT